MIENPHLNTIVCSAIIYIFIVACLRIFGKKELSQLSIVDLVFVLLISNSVQNSMVGSNDTLLGGMLAAMTLFLINKLFKYLLYKSEKFQKFVNGEPVILIRHGKLNKRQLQKSRLSLWELEEACREQGEGDLSQIDLAILEVDGKLSLLTDDKIKPGGRFDTDKGEKDIFSLSKKQKPNTKKEGKTVWT